MGEQVPPQQQQQQQQQVQQVVESEKWEADKQPPETVAETTPDDD